MIGILLKLIIEKASEILYNVYSSYYEISSCILT